MVVLDGDDVVAVMELGAVAFCRLGSLRLRCGRLQRDLVLTSPGQQLRGALASADSYMILNGTLGPHTITL